MSDDTAGTGKEQEGSARTGVGALGPGDSGYDEARVVWNARFESRPEMVVRARTAGDVVDALPYAREHDLALTVKGGGHDYAGNSACDGGLLVDLGLMDAISIDPERRTAVVGAGATWGAFDAAAQEHGLATTGGTVSMVGVAGVTLGGGEGWLSRKHGMSCDNLLAADVVTASGERVRASEEENPDLLWGLRGGGGNFGIVTSFEFALHELDHEVTAGQVIYPFDRAGELLRFFRDAFADAPDEAACFPFMYRVPPLEVFPEIWHGEPVLAFVLAYMGPVAEGEAWLAPFRELGDVIIDGLAPVTYTALQQTFDEGMSARARWFTRAHYFETLADDAIDALLPHVEPLPGEFTAVYFGAGGGAMSRIPLEAAAFPHRDVACGLHIFAGWSDPGRDEEIMAWVRRVSDAVAPYANGGVYVNLLGEDEVARVPDAYGSNYERLVELKRRWDPDNVFRSNHNIPPGA